MTALLQCMVHRDTISLARGKLSWFQRPWLQEVVPMEKEQKSLPKQVHFTDHGYTKAFLQL